MSRILVHAGLIYSSGNPNASSFVIDDGHFAWIGDREASRIFESDVNHVVDLGNAFVAPGFVDAHVHLSATGLQLTGLDLAGLTSAQEALDTLGAACGKGVDTILATGWDDTLWPDAHLWTPEAILTLVGQHTVYLSRIDVHSAMCSASLLGFSEESVMFVTGSDHEIAREQALVQLSKVQREDAIKAALRHAAGQGIVAVHEHGGPSIGGQADFKQSIELGMSPDLPQVFGYWGSTDVAQAQELGAYGVGGDLCVDGSLGSLTALLAQPYEDSHEHGNCYLDEDAIATHLIATTSAGLQAGFHAIGDEAIDRIVRALQQAVSACGASAVRRLRHRIEHAEMVRAEHLETLSDLGVVLSMQPVFDELWGLAGGMYEQRLGSTRVHNMNPFADISQRGIVMAFGSDSPVTPMSPWRAIKAATMHNNPAQRVSARAAFAAHTRGGWRAVHDDQTGVLAVGAPAHFAAWEVEQYVVDVPNSRTTAWSVDPSSGTPPLPDLTAGEPLNLLTCRSGIAIHDPQSVWPHA
jgi:predicted amidohydrolase YtcJ